MTITTNNCPFDSVQLNAEGNFLSYEWNNNTSMSSLTVYESGDYSVIAYDSAGCTATENINIPYIQSFSISTNEILCSGSSIYLQSLVGLDSYLWNTGETTSSISIDEDGIYSIIATANNECELSDEIEIFSTETIQINIQSEMDSLIICSGSEFYFNVTQIFTNVVWNNNFTGLEYFGTASILGENTITVIAQDENGCYSNDTVVLKVVDCSSIEEHLSSTTIYPNPSSGEFIIKNSSLNHDVETINILDIHGRLIEHRKILYNNEVLFEKFYLNAIKSGIYFVEILGKGGKMVKKIILN